MSDNDRGRGNGSNGSNGIGGNVNGRGNGDGISLGRADFGEAIVQYLNRLEPLASCRFCHGGAGPVVPHTQLRKSDVSEGRLLPLARG